MKTEAVTLDLAHDILGNPWLHKAFWTMVLGAATLLAAKLAARGVSRLLHQDSNPLPTSSIIAHARESAGTVSPIVDGPRVFLSEITEFGVKGKVIFQVEDATKTALAADAVVRAISRDLG